MAKRFTDCAIWDKVWFQNLSHVEKCAYFYIKDRCDCVGVWEPNFSLADFQLGLDDASHSVNWELFASKTNGNIEVLADGKWWLVDFCQFQYGELKDSCQPHRSYIEQLKKHGLFEGVVKGYTKGCQTLKEKEKEKDKEKEKEKDGLPFAEIIADLNAKAGTKYKPTSEATRKLIRTRWTQGARLDDFKTVHTKKCKEWLGGEMAKYLRPETLYGAKFEGYLNQLEAPIEQRTGFQPPEDPLDVQDFYTCKKCGRQVKISKRLYQGSTMERYGECSECFDKTGE